MDATRADSAVGSRHFCTYFDHRYLPRGIALHRSLQRHAPGHTLWVLCLDEECERLLGIAQLPGIRLVPLKELEHWDAELAACRPTRSLIEYYFTCSPCLPRYLLAKFAEVGAVTYLDSDLYFFSSPEAVFAEIGAAPVAITPHRFSARRAAKLERYGRFNVGWLSFDRSEVATACLAWWRDRCIEWCYDRLEDERFADQKYLDRFPSLFPSVHVIENPGVNLAPWNFDNYRIEGSQPTVDGVPLVFFHFQGLKHLFGRTFDTRLDEYEARLTPTALRSIYLPYLSELLAAGELAENLGGDGERGEYLRSTRQGIGAAFDRMLLSLRAAASRNLVRVSR